MESTLAYNLVTLSGLTARRFRRRLPPVVSARMMAILAITTDPIRPYLGVLTSTGRADGTRLYVVTNEACGR
jgi:hypothetical protein